MHDALRGDALQILQWARSGETSSVSAIAAELKAHAEEFTSAIQSNRQRALPERVSQLLQQLQPSLDAYLAQAQTLADMAQSHPAEAEASLAAFQQAYAALEDPMG